ncbi:MAG: hypothetical protein KAS38_08685 [Anaerolineales bacterium]|nr:hypothetical protein [Anaerolineales bacterium]MCK4978592.1 hypothetical protein [Anaerolineales bacterium]
MQTIKDLIIRHHNKEDAQQTLDLLIRCDISEYGEPDSDIEDVQLDWSQIDLKRDAWLAATPAGDFAGYAAVLPYGEDLRFDFYVDPTWKNNTLGVLLLASCESHGFDLYQERPENTGVIARTFISHVNQRDQQVVEAAGFTPGK